MKSVIIFLLFIYPVNAQLLVSSEFLQFPETLTGARDSLELTITNISNIDIIISSFRHYSTSFSFSDSLFTVSASGTVSLMIYYSPVHNVIDNDIIIFESAETGAAAVVRLSGSGMYNDIYQTTTFNLYDNDLKNALFSLVNNHTSLGYNLARDKMYMEIDNKKNNGQGAAVNTLECVYTGREAVGYLSRTDCQTNYNFNTEHTWPQSYFGSSEPMLSDLFHLYPTDVNANSVRGNLHFGRAVSSIDWQIGGSKRGKDSLNELVFEPRDVHKGNVARSLLYFTIRYTNMGGFLDQKQEDLFRIWNYSDPADTIERRRNSDIASYQQKRNPFIDHPEFIDRIYSFRTNQERPKYAMMETLPKTLFFDSTDTGDTSAVYFYLLNGGNLELTISSIETAEPFYLDSTPDLINPYSFEKVYVRFAPQTAGIFNGFVLVNTIEGQDTIVVSGYGTENITLADSDPLIESFQLFQNYPNPFNPSTEIKYYISEASPVNIKLYDVLGNEVTTLVDEVKAKGEYKYTFNSGAYSSGVYYYKISAGAYSSVKKMMILK